MSDTFIYSKTLVDEITNDPDAAAQSILDAMNGDVDEVTIAANSLLKAAEAAPQKVADVLAKVAKLNPAKYTKVRTLSQHCGSINLLFFCCYRGRTVCQVGFAIKPRVISLRCGVFVYAQTESLST